jgi:hypothetical protein
MTSLADEHLKPYLGRMTSLQWFGASIVMGIFLGFVDTLFIACVMGYLGLQLPAWFGVPTTFTGFFMSGWIVGRFGPRGVSWEPPAGILVCVLLLMLGLSRPELGGVGSALRTLFNYVLVPLSAMAICFLGMYVGKNGWQPIKDYLKRKRPSTAARTGGGTPA